MIEPIEMNLLFAFFFFSRRKLISGRITSFVQLDRISNLRDYENENEQYACSFIRENMRSQMTFVYAMKKGLFDPTSILLLNNYRC